MRKTCVALGWVFMLALSVVAATALAQAQAGGVAGVAPDQGASGPGKPGTVPYAPRDVLYDNGPLVTHPTGGCGGLAASRLQNSAPLNMTVLGFRADAPNRHLADDFTVPCGAWQIDSITFYGFQQGSSTVSTFTEVRVRIWDGQPNGGGTVIWGDLTTNRLAATGFSGIFRDRDSDPADCERPIMYVTAAIDTILTTGTYWVDFQLLGTETSNELVPETTILGSTSGCVPGPCNGLEWIPLVSAWWPLMDPALSFLYQDVKFEISGTLQGTDLSIDKTAVPDPVLPGEALTYRVVVSNNGPYDATSLEVSDTLPGGVTYLSAAGDGWSCGEAGGIVTCTMPTLQSGQAAADIVIEVTAPPVGGDIENTAEVNACEIDPDPSNNTVTQTTSVGVAPTITSADQTTFVVGQLGSFTVTATGTPAPTLAMTAGSLPSGVTFEPGTGVLSGTPEAGTAGVYPVTFTASNGVDPDAEQPFTLTVNEAPTITSADQTTFVVGQLGSFTVTATGTPAPTLAMTAGSLPSGVTFEPGTGVLAGTPEAGTTGVYPVTFTASNGVDPDAEQPFTLTVNEAPAFTSADQTTFVVGQLGSFTVTATGSPSPTLAMTAGSLPSGVTFEPGTGVLTGTPAAGTAGVYPVTFTASNGVDPDAEQPFTLTVNEAPTITSADQTTFVVGQLGSFTVTATGTPAPTLAMTAGSLPSGVTFEPGTGVLAGTPDAGTVGVYPVTFTASNGVDPDATQGFTLTVNQAPAFTSADHASFNMAQPGTFTVTATGTPVPALSLTAGALPRGVTFVAGGPGTAVLSGVAPVGQAGTWPLELTASNGVDPDAVQVFTLTVVGARTTTNVSSNINPSHVGQAVRLTGRVTFTTRGIGTPTGTLTFYVDEEPPVVVPMVGGAAYITRGDLAAGMHAVRVVYSGNGAFAPSTGTLAGGQVVNELL